MAPTLTARVFKAVDSVGQEADAAQEASPLLLVNLLVVPHADCDRVGFPDVSEEGGGGEDKEKGERLMFDDGSLGDVTRSPVRWNETQLRMSDTDASIYIGACRYLFYKQVGHQAFGFGAALICMKKKCKQAAFGDEDMYQMYEPSL